MRSTISRVSIFLNFYERHAIFYNKFNFIIITKLLNCAFKMLRIK